MGRNEAAPRVGIRRGLVHNSGEAGMMTWTCTASAELGFAASSGDSQRLFLNVRCSYSLEISMTKCRARAKFASAHDRTLPPLDCWLGHNTRLGDSNLNKRVNNSFNQCVRPRTPHAKRPVHLDQTLR